MKISRRKICACLLLCTVCAYAQTQLTNAGFSAWKQNNLQFAVFDMRTGHAIDSVIYPCFYTGSPSAWVDSMGCKLRMLVVADSAAAALAGAQAIASRGIAAESLYYCSYGAVTTSRMPAADTLPLSFLGTGKPIPQALTAYELRSIILSKRPCKLIDVRSAFEVATGLIPGACNMAWQEPFKTNSAGFNKSEHIVLYCGSGSRAGQARTYLIANGFDSTKVINFGGYSKWTGSGQTYAMQESPDCGCTFVLTLASVNIRPSSIAIIERRNGFIGIALPAPERLASVTVYDVWGKAVVTRELLKGGRCLLDANKIPPGPYFIRAKSGKHRYAARFLLAE